MGINNVLCRHGETSKGGNMARKKGSKNRRRQNILQSNEQVFKEDGVNQYYIGNKLGGTFIGNDEIGYIHKSTMLGGHGYSRTFGQMIHRLRIQYWYRRF